MVLIPKAGFQALRGVLAMHAVNRRPGAQAAAGLMGLNSSINSAALVLVGEPRKFSALDIQLKVR